MQCIPLCLYKYLMSKVPDVPYLSWSITIGAGDSIRNHDTGATIRHIAISWNIKSETEGSTFVITSEEIKQKQRVNTMSTFLLLIVYTRKSMQSQRLSIDQYRKMKYCYVSVYTFTSCEEHS